MSDKKEKRIRRIVNKCSTDYQREMVAVFGSYFLGMARKKQIKMFKIIAKKKNDPNFLKNLDSKELNND